MKLHELKIKHEYLIDVTIGTKTFELRKNDRDYQVGDLIRFIDITKDYTENDEENPIAGIMKGINFGQKVVFSIPTAGKASL